MLLTDEMMPGHSFSVEMKLDLWMPWVAIAAGAAHGWNCVIWWRLARRREVCVTEEVLRM